MNKDNRGNICGKRIRIARIRRDMAQADMVAALEVDFGIILAQTTISQIEQGKRILKDFELMAIAKVLGVSLEWLLEEERTRSERE